MTLPLQRQLDLAISGISQGDFDLMEQALVSPDSLTMDETRSVAEMLGLSRGFLSAAVNIVTDPTVIFAAMLSRKFPTSQYIRGAIPQRFIGTANRFTGVSTVARTVEGFFRGTHVPRLTDLILRRQAEVLKVGNRIFDNFLFRPNWNTTEMETVSLLLEGRSPRGATPELRNLATKVRGHVDELWGFLSRTHKVSGGFDEQMIMRASSGPFTLGQAPKYLRDYLPHIPLFSAESTFEVSGKRALARFARNKSSQAAALVGEDPAHVWLVDQADRLTSNYERYQAYLSRTKGEVFSPRLFKRQRHGLALQTSEGADLFITDLNVILQRYIHSVSRTYALNAPLTEVERALVSIPSEVRGIRTMPTAEPPIVQIINQGLDTAGGRMMRQQVAGTEVFKEMLVPGSPNAPTMGALRNLVRNLTGKSSEDEILFGNVIDSIRWKISQTRARLGKRQVDQIDDGLAIMERQSRDRLMTNRLTSYFYGTVLLNPLSGMKNLLQPFLTTAPAIGLGPTLKGIGILMERRPAYFREFHNQRRLLRSSGVNIPYVQRLNLAQEKAFHRTFPELAETGVAIDPRAFDLDQRFLDVHPITGKSKFRSLDEFNRFMLQPFTQTEIANKVVTFYGGRVTLRNDLRTGALEVPRIDGVPLHGADLSRFVDMEAGRLTAATQFSPGPGSRTVFQSHIPAPLRMFTSFYTRLGNFFAESTVRGALTDKQLQTAGFLEKLTGGRNWGTVARTLVLGRSINLGLREGLGVDMGDALGVTGPFSNIAPSGQLFAPLPVSPIPGVVFGLASFATTKDLKDMQPLELPMVGQIPIPKTLVPGGIAISRASRALRQYRPDLGGFVDDDERLMFQGDTPDLMLAMLGIPLDKQRRLREKVGQLQANRDRSRRYKRRFAVATRNYDYDEMDKLSASYTEEFPDFGPLALSHHDLRRYDEQARLTALQRMLQSLGRNADYLESETWEYDSDLMLVGKE